MRLSRLLLLAGLGACAPGVAPEETPAAPQSGDPDLGAGDSDEPALPEPVLFVHGINGSAADYAVMIERLIADGWPADRLYARTFPDPSWGCNVDNAETIRGWVEEIEAAHGVSRLDIVAHSMGSLSSRWFVKILEGTSEVGTYVTLGGMHHGLWAPCLSVLPVCVWEELCETGDFIETLGTAPVTPGPARWVSIFSDGDSTVPAESSELDGAENLLIPDVAHAGDSGLQQHPAVYAEVKRVLLYP